jgi:hypothetical protein
MKKTLQSVIYKYKNIIYRINMTEQKKCKKCGEVKDLTEYQSTKGLYNTTCKACEKIQREVYDMGINANLDEVAYNSRFDILAARELLEWMGYSLHKPIYLQFNERMKEKYGITFGEGRKRGKYKKKD